MAEKLRRLTRKQAIFVSAIIAGKSAIQAAVESGSTESSSAKTAYRMIRVPAVAAAIKEDQDKIRAKGLFNVETAMDRAKESYNVAKETENANAMVKATELMAKLHGLLIERHQHDIKHIDIKSALDAGDERARLREVGPVPTSQTTGIARACLTGIQPTHSENHSDIDTQPIKTTEE